MRSRNQLAPACLLFDCSAPLGLEEGVDFIGYSIVFVDPAFELVKTVLFRVELFPGVIVNKPKVTAFGAEPQVSVVLAQKDPILSPAREHSIGFIGAFGDKVIDQNTDVGFISTQREGGLSRALEVAVDS